jgi:aspartyl-tRNA(Asn)/glutamyl-tRNA(Gln) amidotransferase subunit A
MARRIADVVTALDVVVSPEQSDLRSLPRPEASWPAVLDAPHVPARIAWSPTLGYAEVDREVLALCERALGVLESLGADIVEVETIFPEDPVEKWLTITNVCNLRTLGPYRQHPEWARVDPLLAALVEVAETTSGVRLIEMLDEQHRMNLALVELFHDVRLLVTPTCAAVPPPLALGGLGMINGEEHANWVQLTYPFNMTRSPAASVPVGLSESGLPVGLQLIGPQHGDLVVLRSAAALEAAIGFDALADLAAI